MLGISFAFTGVKLWNSLPSSLTEETFLNEKNSKLIRSYTENREVLGKCESVTVN